MKATKRNSFYATIFMQKKFKLLRKKNITYVLAIEKKT